MDPAVFFVFIIPLFIAIGIGIRLFIGTLNHQRIRKQITHDGGRVKSIEWAPFGPGWYGDQSVIYRVVYVDRDGAVHEAFCKTGPLAGVYFTQDKIRERRGTVGQESDQTLEEENRRLRAEVERLKRR